MSWIYQKVIRPVLFRKDSEEIHNQTLSGLAFASRHEALLGAIRATHRTDSLPVSLFGLQFSNPVGLAAGMDKKAAALPAWDALGFGFSEMGGVTLHAQPGNPQPRMFRAVDEEALINRMGFNNPGAEAMAQQLKQWRERGLWPKHPVGMNLGKSKITPLEEAASDYAGSFKLLRAYVDFFVVNVSSPNTPNLRQLQDKAALTEILNELEKLNKPSIEQGLNIPRRPILVKVAPDLTFEALDEIISLVQERNVDGIVATNTTIARPNTSTARAKTVFAETGGLSGAPLRARSTEVIRHLYQQSRGAVPIIGVGGIMSPAHAWEKITAGASLVQIYSGLVYKGPGLVAATVKYLQQQMTRHGLSQISEAIGLEHRKKQIK
ncbi:MAG: quinone-dependent dihydroorotate dehydrogenase [Verrucomicrobiales bacterium]